ncbi:GNAT family N-acetyltransferase [Natronosporangium hydrolyticum]|uniref:GNAT family N-acetyltransferase n=1 Tax=Natronosporangium hydrolyticum TaxID=2811111 RepID=A0A895YBG1_9ACTN|nr:GNAT family N-acetyltransferase [Natronosporangium hydrolyticum]QSB12803.1 GNAT family N-acetyltransferase [Natronosporangium hydrolyticum]
MTSSTPSPAEPLLTLTDRVDIDELAQVYRTVHTADLYLPDHREPSVEQRLAWTAQAPGFQAALGWQHDRVVGAILGCPLPAETGWWRDLPADPELVREWPGRTFAVCEAFVLPELRRHQLGLRLFAELLGARGEERASLAVADSNTPVARSMQSLGWQHVGELVPFPGWRPHGMFLRPLPWRQPAGQPARQ